MFKILLINMMLSLSIMAQTFNFTELRYSDAIGKTIELHGEITFVKDGLSINYPKTKRVLKYSGDTLVYEVDKQEVELGLMQQMQIKNYFDMLILLHSGDESALNEMFELEKKDAMMMLRAKGSIKDYITKIELLKQNKQLDFVKLFLTNNDTIMITIDEKIR